MLWCVLNVVPPNFLPPIPEEAVEAEVRRVAGECGDAVKVFVARGRTELEAAWDTIRGCTDVAAVTIAVVCGHGRSATTVGRDESVNILYVADTDQRDQTLTSVDLDQLLQCDEPKARGPLLVVLDVCAVRVREVHHAGSSVAVLLANPNGYAESTSGVGILTRSFLRSYEDSPRDSSLRAVVERAVDRTRTETSGRQNPQLVHLGDWSFLDRPARPTLVSTPGTGGVVGPMVRALVDLAHEDRLPSAVVARLFESLGGTVTDNDPLLELRLAIAALGLKPAPEVRKLDGVRRLFDQARAAVSPLTRAKAAHWLAWAEYRLGNRSRALVLLEEAVSGLPKDAPGGVRAQLLDTLGTVRREGRQFKDAIDAYDESLKLKAGIDDLLGHEMTRQNLGWCRLLRGQFAAGERHFREGYDACRQLLDRGHAGGIEAYHSTLTSLELHLLGLVTSKFLGPFEKDQFIRLTADSRAHLNQADRLVGWGVKTKAPLGRLLLDLGLRTRRTAPTAEADDPLSHFWVHVAACTTEGAPRIASLEREVFARMEVEPEKIPDYVRISYLAGFNYLSQVLESRAAVDIRNRFVEFLRDRCGYDGLPSAEGAVWADMRGWTGLRLDTSGWLEWGPLAAQVHEARLPDLVVSPVVTEHYIQLLSWVSGLLLALEGGLDCARLLQLLDAEFDRGDSVKLNLGQSLQFAHRVAHLADCRSDWGQELKRTWTACTFVEAGGYQTLPDIPKQRNQTSHFKAPTRHQAQRVLDQHAAVIREMLRPLAKADWPEVAPSGKAVSESAELHSAILSTSRRQKLDCGPLLVVHRDQSSYLYVPHELDRKTLRGLPNGMCKFQFYGTGLGSQVERVMGVRWSPPS